MDTNIEMWELLDKNGAKTGRLHQRGKPLSADEYFLTVHVWIQNSNGDFLITRRAESQGHLWHTTGGCVVAGDDSITSALRETREEIGIILQPEAAQFYGRVLVKRINDDGYMFQDVWLFRTATNVDISSVVLQTEEICDVKWANAAEIMRMADEGAFVPLSDWYPYLSEFWSSVAR